jgi:[pyruvate, water dikinase]-phosphate phosphotransferase / [pyruvate, water dikinase] kinase
VVLGFPLFRQAWPFGAIWQNSQIKTKALQAKRNVPRTAFRFSSAITGTRRKLCTRRHQGKKSWLSRNKRIASEPVPQLSRIFPGVAKTFGNGRRKGREILGRHYFHLHLISDATGETLIAASRAATAQYEGVTSIEHVYPLVRSRAQIDKAVSEVEAAPGIVLYTLVDQDLANRLEAACKELSVPCLSVLEPILNLFQSYIGAASIHRPGAQHMLNSEYFRRIEALNFAMLHDDGQQIENFEKADVVLLGVSRTSKTPTSIYLANRGIKAANVPIVPDVPLPEPILALRGPLVVGLIASVERIIQIRENRLLALKARPGSPYVDRFHVAAEVSRARRLCAEHGWPIIDVTHRSIEETAAAVIDFYKIHQLKFIAAS